MCPRCRQNAPIVYRGVNAFCTACGAPRSVLANTSVNLAGQPSKVGGQVTRVLFHPAKQRPRRHGGRELDAEHRPQVFPVLELPHGVDYSGPLGRHP